MTGLSQVSSAGNMPKNCGMEGMHGGAAKQGMKPMMCRCKEREKDRTDRFE